MAPQQRRSFQGDGSAEIEVVTHGFGTGIRELVNLKFLPNEQLPLDTPLWRYMKLSTFFLLLRDKAFIPRLQKLQEGDPQEGRILTETPYREEFLKSDEFMSAWDWLKAKHDSRLFVLNQLHGDHGPQLLKEWRYQLSTRRCAWCWFCPTKDSQSFHVESMAMWNLYARDGVAVSTTLAAVKSAIQEPELDELLVANVHYAECDAGMEHVKRPFLFKSGRGAS